MILKTLLIKSAPSVRILFYTDSALVHLIPIPKDLKILRHTVHEVGLSILKDTLEKSLYPKISVTLINRFWEDLSSNEVVNSENRKPEPTRITSELLRDYDELWFFGQHLGSFTPGDDGNGYPESSLNDNELNALGDWMNNGGGVLILGDHSNRVVDQSVLPEIKWWNLGRALGKDILRAGKMRIWEGPEGTAYKIDDSKPEQVVNTSGDTIDMIWMPKQEDTNPQTLNPVFFPQITHSVGCELFSYSGSYHPLFTGIPNTYNPDGIIKIMADHGHEGVLATFQDYYNKTEWPISANGYQPKPVVIAYGTNKNTSKPVALISAYDGQPVGVGRIVAHTTWHHFADVNLHGFQVPEAVETWTTLSQYYVNLAWWLLTKDKRRNALPSILTALVTNLCIRDQDGASYSIIGKTAFALLDKVVTRGQIQDMIYLAVEEMLSSKQSRSVMEYTLPNFEYILGSMVAQQQAQSSISNDDENDDHSSSTLKTTVQGVKQALRDQIKELETRIQAFSELLE